MTTTYSYACKDYPEIEACPGYVVAEREAEVCRLMGLYSALARGEDPGAWSAEDRTYLKTLLKTT